MKTAAVLVAMLMLSACAGNSEVEGERVTVEDGEVSLCGEGNGLPECRDFTGETYSEELKYKAPSDDQMAEEAEKVRAESPEELDRTISGMEDNPAEYGAD